MRGQTTLDFVIGVSIFLAAVLFTFGFIPGLLEPFDAAAEENPTLADRYADTLSQDVLGSPKSPHTLDRYCAVSFFEAGSSAPAECEYTGTTLEEHLGVPASQRVNVTITSDGDTQLCWTESTAATGGPGLTESCSSGDVVLSAGQRQPAIGETTISARRVVSLHDRSVMLEVIVW
jgi:hypothetical protein